MKTFTPREYLQIDIANNYGCDKMTWANRLAWFSHNEPKLRELVASAEEPALFYAGVLAWEAVQRSEPIGYMVSLDATSSGLQILAALTSDRTASQLCNVVDTGDREDAYTAVYLDMVDEVGDPARIDREKCKQAIKL